MPKGAKRPVAGYPTIRAAVAAMTAEGKPPKAIAEACGLSLARVYKERARVKANQAPAGAGEDTRGIWTLEKMQKVRRVTAKALEVIAEAYQVPAKEVLKLIVSGTLPPVGKRQRVAQLIDEIADSGSPQQAGGLSAGGEAVTDASPPLLLAAPTREDDEAELAQLADADDDGADDETDVSPQRLYRLKQPFGECWLSDDCVTYTANRKDAWSGAAPDMERLFKGNPKLKSLDPERVP